MARDVVDKVSEAIRTSGEDVYALTCNPASGSWTNSLTAGQDITPCSDDVATVDNPYAGYCVGNTGYIWQHNIQLDKDSANPVFVKITDCDPNKSAKDNYDSTSRVELLHPGMRIGQV